MMLESQAFFEMWLLRKVGVRDELFLVKAREQDGALQVIVALFLNEYRVSYIKPGSFIRSKEKTCLPSRSPVNMS